MPKFSLEQKLPACFVSKDLLSAIEAYLNLEMRQKLGELVGDKITYRISIEEKIGTETLASISEYSPSTFPDGTKLIQVRWDNGYQADYQIDLDIRFDGDPTTPISRLKVDCSAPTARETAMGIGDGIFRLLNSHRTLNWIFNPFEVPFVSLFGGLAVFSLLVYGFGVLYFNRQQALYLLSGAALVGWIFLSAMYFRPFVSFDTRRQRLLDRVWWYFSLGTIGFILFGTLLPLVRKTILGF